MPPPLIITNFSCMYPLAEAEKKLLETRLQHMEQHPEKSIPWSEAKKRIEAKFGQ
jgi:hypothetical protein